MLNIYVELADDTGRGLVRYKQVNRNNILFLFTCLYLMSYNNINITALTQYVYVKLQIKV